MFQALAFLKHQTASIVHLFVRCQVEPIDLRVWQICELVTINLLPFTPYANKYNRFSEDNWYLPARNISVNAIAAIVEKTNASWKVVIDSSGKIREICP